MKIYFILIVSLFICCSNSAQGDGNVSDRIRISSETLGYDLHYSVYTPSGYKNLSQLPSIYVTDGPYYVKEGKMPELLDSLINKKIIKPTVAIFIDTINPDNAKLDRRSYELSCNPKYVSFVVDELVPIIDAKYHTGKKAIQRAILGHSLGVLKAACFGLLASSSFANLGVLSPATSPVPKLFNYYRDIEKLPLKFFISSGSIRDNQKATKKLKRVLLNKGYPVKYKLNKGKGHNWTNWKGILDDVLIYFFSTD